VIIIAGEALVDMVANQDKKQTFTGVPGGAAYNVACALGLLETQPGFVCPISNDKLGDLLLARMQECGAEYLLKQRVNAPTPLALVTVDDNSQPSYSFYRQGTADRMLHHYDMHKVAPTNTQIVHITGFCLNEADDYQQWLTLINAARAQGAIISVDPNVRESLISDPEDYRKRIKALLAIAHIVKLSDEDLQYLYPELSLADAQEKLQSLTLLSIITLGSKGAQIICDGRTLHIDARKIEHIVDTVGAGDCFSAAYLYQLQYFGITKPEQLTLLDKQQMIDMVTFASTAAAINCGRKGCQPPTVDEIKNYA